MTIRPNDFYSDRHYVPNAHRRKQPIKYLSGAPARRPDALRGAKAIFRTVLIAAAVLGVCVVVWRVWHG